MPCPERPGIAPKDRGRGQDRQRQTAPHAPEGVATPPQAPALAHTPTGLAPSGQAAPDAALRQPQPAPGPGGRPGRQAFGAEAARTAPGGAAARPDPARDHHAAVCPGASRAGALIHTVAAAHGKPAHGTVPQGLSRGDTHGERGGHLVQMPRLQVLRSTRREHRRPACHRPPGRHTSEAIPRRLAKTRPPEATSWETREHFTQDGQEPTVSENEPTIIDST